MMTSQILKSTDFTKIQKSRYLENETFFFFQIKKFINYTSRATLCQKNSFIAEVTFKNTNAFETGLSDVNLLIYSMLKTSFQKNDIL